VNLRKISQGNVCKAGEFFYIYLAIKTSTKQE